MSEVPLPPFPPPGTVPSLPPGTVPPFPLPGTGPIDIRDPILVKLIKQNRKWAEGVKAQDPNFFTNSAKEQTPKVLWIGCSDSRVPESVILGCMPGQIFTHRNIANQVHLDDINLQSVLVYAIAELGVEHIIVCGHSHCGGVGVCVDGTSPAKALCFPGLEDRAYHDTEPQQTAHWPPPAPIDAWLRDLRELAVKSQYPVEVLAIENVRVQVGKVMQSKVVQQAWAHRGKSHLLGVHGWLYHLEAGEVQDLGFSHYGPEPKHWGHPSWKGRRLNTNEADELLVGGAAFGLAPSI